VDAASLGEVVGVVPETPFSEAVSDAVTRFRRLIADGLIPPELIDRLLA
jgi:hypothetical protein